MRPGPHRAVTGAHNRVTWWGALIPDGQREAMMAEAMAQLRGQGHKDVEAADGPQRWVRGVLRIRPQGGAAAAAEGWEEFWLDEKVPALFGRTPRQAARGRERPYLEAVLRQLQGPGHPVRVAGRALVRPG